MTQDIIDGQLLPDDNLSSTGQEKGGDLDPPDTSINSHGLSIIPESLEELSRVNPKHLGGVSQAILVPAMVNAINSQLYQTQSELKSTKEALKEADQKISDQALQIERLNGQLDKKNSLSPIKLLLNTLGLSLFSYGVSLYPTVEFRNTSFVLFAIGILMVIVSWNIEGDLKNWISSMRGKK